MSISSDFIQIIEIISNKISIPLIKEIVVPIEDRISKKSNFAAVILDDNTIGIFFINLNSKIKEMFKKFNSEVYIGTKPEILAKKFKSQNLFDRSLGLGAINTISQFLFKKSDYSFEYATDPLGLLEIEKKDIVGMVGFFPSLINLIEKVGNRLIVIEKKKDLMKKGKNWKVTLNPSELELCNKVLITSTTVLNETIDAILNYCSNAEKISMIGPTAGFLPDPLFERGIDVIGGTQVMDSSSLIHALKSNVKWGPSVKKYIIKQSNYIGYEEILKKIKI